MISHMVSPLEQDGVVEIDFGRPLVDTAHDVEELAEAFVVTDHLAMGCEPLEVVDRFLVSEFRW